MASPYDYRWQKAREFYLVEHPLCIMCKAEGRTEPATVVDHKVPHRGDMDLFWDQDNWQGLCAPHHNSVKQGEEKRGYSLALDDSGWPLDPRHPSNKRRRPKALCTRSKRPR